MDAAGVNGRDALRAPGRQFLNPALRCQKIRRNCFVTMGYEIVVPKGHAPNSGQTINRRYTNIYYSANDNPRLSRKHLAGDICAVRFDGAGILR
jgi:hypothetical protein